MPSSRGSSRPRDWTQVSNGSWITGGFFSAKPPQKPLCVCVCVCVFFFRLFYLTSHCSCCSSGCQSCPTLQYHGLQHTRIPCPSPSPKVCSNSCPLSRWCHPTISSSVTPFSSCLQPFPASGPFPMSGCSHQVAKVLELQHQSFQWIFRTDFLSDWLVGSPCSPRDSKSLLQHHSMKHQFFSTQPSLWSNSHICTWLLEES